MRVDCEGHPAQGRELVEHVAFEASPASLRDILWAPNHVRAWRAHDYWRLRGHDEALEVGDDHDLCCRMYLATRCARIDRGLYLYREHAENTYQERLARIRAQSDANQVKYFVPMVSRWADLRGLPKIDLGGRFGCPEGWMAVDRRPPAAIVADLRERWPFEDSSVGAIRAADVLEHLPDKMHVMDELHRVLVPGGFVIVSSPSTDGRGAWQDPTHVSGWNENSFWYWTEKRFAAYIDRPALFQRFRCFTWFPSDWHRQHQIPYVAFEGAARKDGGPRYPGLLDPGV